jgi:hypothetical protein
LGVASAARVADFENVRRFNQNENPAVDSLQKQREEIKD